MARGRRNTEPQGQLWIPARQLPRSPGHVFYEKLNGLVAEAEFDLFGMGTPRGLQPGAGARAGRWRAPQIPQKLLWPLRTFTGRLAAHGDSMFPRAAGRRLNSQRPVTGSIQQAAMVPQSVRGTLAKTAIFQQSL